MLPTVIALMTLGSVVSSTVSITMALFAVAIDIVDVAVQQ